VRSVKHNSDRKKHQMNWRGGSELTEGSGDVDNRWAGGAWGMGGSRAHKRKREDKVLSG